MAIAFDAATEDKTTTANVLTYSHTCTGSDRFLYVAFTTLSNNHTVTSVTYGGAAMTTIATEVLVFSPTWRHHGYYLANPASGTNNVVITCASISFSIRSSCVSYTGVDQTSPILDDNIASSASGNTMSIPLTTAEAGWAVISGANVDTAFTAGTNTDTLRASYAGLCDIADSDGDIAASTFNAQMTHGGTRGYGGIAFGLKASAGGGPTYRFNPQLTPFAGL